MFYRTPELAETVALVALGLHFFLARSAKNQNRKNAFAAIFVRRAKLGGSALTFWRGKCFMIFFLFFSVHSDPQRQKRGEISLTFLSDYPLKPLFFGRNRLLDT